MMYNSLLDIAPDDGSTVYIGTVPDNKPMDHFVKADEVVVQIPLSDIFCDEVFNVRGKLQPMDYISLAAKMKTNGQIQPIVVQPWDSKPYRVVCGHCRIAAAKYLGWATIAAVVRNYTAREAGLVNISENVDRSQLNIEQESNAVRFLISTGLSFKQVQAVMSESLEWVKIRADFGSLPKDIQDEANTGHLTDRDLKIILKMPTTAKKYEVVRKIKTKRERLLRQVDSIGVMEETVSKLVTPKTRRIRNRQEMDKMKMFIMMSLGPSLATRVLAWAQGIIDTDAIYDDMEEVATEQGIDFVRPKFEPV